MNAFLISVSIETYPYVGPWVSRYLTTLKLSYKETDRSGSSYSEDARKNILSGGREVRGKNYPSI